MSSETLKQFTGLLCSAWHICIQFR